MKYEPGFFSQLLLIFGLRQRARLVTWNTSSKDFSTGATLVWLTGGFRKNWNVLTMRKCMMIYKRNLPLLPRQLFPRQVPLVTHMRQDIPITAGILGADLYPPAFWHENKFILATNLMAVSTLMASDFKSRKYNNCQFTWIMFKEKLLHLYKYFSLMF